MEGSWRIVFPKMATTVPPTSQAPVQCGVHQEVESDALSFEFRLVFVTHLL